MLRRDDPNALSLLAPNGRVEKSRKKASCAYAQSLGLRKGSGNHAIHSPAMLPGEF